MTPYLYQPKSGLVVAITFRISIFGWREQAKTLPQAVDKPTQESKPATPFKTYVPYN